MRWKNSFFFLRQVLICRPGWSESSACLCLSVVSATLPGGNSFYAGHHCGHVLLSFPSPVPTPTPAGSYQCACFTDGEAQREWQAASLTLLALLATYKPPTSFGSSCREDFIRSRSAVSCFFLHLGFALYYISQQPAFLCTVSVYQPFSSHPERNCTVHGNTL